MTASIQENRDQSLGEPVSGASADAETSSHPSGQAASHLDAARFDPARYCGECGILLPLETRRKLTAVVLREARIGVLQGQLLQLADRASDVMAMLDAHGGVIVPHLLDTDDNAGQFLREAVESARAVAAMESGQ